MSDTALPVIIRFDTTANRMAFTPTPGVTEQLYIWLDSDDQPNAYYWDGAAWQVFNGGSSSGTVTNTGTLTDHALMVGNGGVDISALGSLGTTVTVLHGNAAGDPSFGAVALASDVSGVLPGLNGGGLVLLEQHSASGSASLNFTAAITSTYDEYIIEFISIIPATDAVNLWMRMSTDGGSSYDTTAIYSYESYLWRAASAGNNGAVTQAQIVVNVGTTISNSTSWGFNGSLRLFNPLSASVFKQLNGELSFFSSGSLRVGTVLHASYESATAVNAFQFLMSSGNIASGTIRVYGISK